MVVLFMCLPFYFSRGRALAGDVWRCVVRRLQERLVKIGSIPKLI